MLDKVCHSEERINILFGNYITWTSPLPSSIFCQSILLYSGDASYFPRCAVISWLWAHGPIGTLSCMQQEKSTGASYFVRASSWKWPYIYNSTVEHAGIQSTLTAHNCDATECVLGVSENGLAYPPQKIYSVYIYIYRTHCIFNMESDDKPVHGMRFSIFR